MHEPTKEHREVAAAMWNTTDVPCWACVHAIEDTPEKAAAVYSADMDAAVEAYAREIADAEQRAIAMFGDRLGLDPGTVGNASTEDDVYDHVMWMEKRAERRGAEREREACADLVASTCSVGGCAAAHTWAEKIRARGAVPGA